MMDVVIRRLDPEESSILEEMLYEAIYVPEGTPKPPREILKKPELERYIANWGRSNDIGFLAVMGEKVIGAAWARVFEAANPGYGFVDAHTPELSIAVMSGYRGQGIGTILLQHLLAELWTLGFSAVSLSVDPNNPAVRLYKRFGFETVGVKGTSNVMVCKRPRS